MCEKNYPKRSHYLSANVIDCLTFARCLVQQLTPLLGHLLKMQLIESPISAIIAHFNCLALNDDGAFNSLLAYFLDHNTTHTTIGLSTLG